VAKDLQKTIADLQQKVEDQMKLKKEKRRSASHGTRVVGCTTK